MLHGERVRVGRPEHLTGMWMKAGRDAHVCEVPVGLLHGAACHSVLGDTGVHRDQPTAVGVLVGLTGHHGLIVVFVIGEAATLDVHTDLEIVLGQRLRVEGVALGQLLRLDKDALHGEVLTLERDPHDTVVVLVADFHLSHHDGARVFALGAVGHTPVRTFRYIERPLLGGLDAVAGIGDADLDLRGGH